jgi:hypothetical protein
MADKCPFKGLSKPASIEEEEFAWNGGEMTDEEELTKLFCISPLSAMRKVEKENATLKAENVTLRAEVAALKERLGLWHPIGTYIQDQIGIAALDDPDIAKLVTAGEITEDGFYVKIP